MTKPEPLYFDDFQVGRTFTSGTLRVDEAEIKEFAAKYDPQPFHLDNEAAKATMFQGLAASGWHTMGMTMRNVFRPANTVPYPRRKVGRAVLSAPPLEVRQGSGRTRHGVQNYCRAALDLPTSPP